MSMILAQHPILSMFSLKICFHVDSILRPTTPCQVLSHLQLCYKYRLSSTPKNDFLFDFFSKMPNLRAEKIFLENLTILAKLTFQALARGISRFSVRWPVFES